MRRAFRDAALALSILTVVPVHAEWPGEGERSQAAAWFPAVGALLGLVLADLLMVSLKLGVLFGPVLALIAYWALSAFLHWDGLADTADAWSVASDRRHEVLKDSRIGTFGVLAVVIVFTLQVLSVVQLGMVPVGRVPMALVVTVPFFGRLAATFACWLGKAARAEGLGAAVVGAPSRAGLVIGAVTYAVVCTGALAQISSPALGAVWLAGGTVFALAVPHLISQRFGGVTGDVLGASIVVVETAMLMVLAFWMVL